MRCKADDNDLRHIVMKIIVHLAPYGAGVEKEHTIELFCGVGSQILQWVGYSACTRLAHDR